MRVSVIIPTIDGLPLLQTCLPALHAQTFRDFETIVVDDGGSRDGSQEFLRRNHPGVRLVCLPRNLGYAGACNAGLRCASGELVGVLGNDNRPEPTWLAELVNVFDRRPGVSLVVSKSPEPSWPWPDPFGTLSVLGYNRILTANLRSAEPQATFYGSGNAFLCRRALIERFYDDAYRMYGEDVSLGWRLRLQGGEVCYAPASITHHQGSATTSRRPWRKVYFQTRNRLLNLLLHHERGTLLRLLPCIAADVTATLLLRPGRAARLTAITWLVSSAPWIARSRREIQRRRRRRDADLLPYFAPAPWFLKGLARWVGWSSLGDDYRRRGIS